MEYGGADLTRCLHTLLSRAGFPYKECDLNNRFDAQFLMQIKESLLHMDQVCAGWGGGLRTSATRALAGTN